MDEDTGGTFIVLEDENGESYELELLAEMEYNGETFKAFLPADMDEDDYARMLQKGSGECPLWRNGDEYAVVRHQM